MGADSIRTMSIAFACMGCAIFYFSPNSVDPVISLSPYLGIPEQTVKSYIAKYMKNYVIEAAETSPKQSSSQERLLTAEELAKHDGSSDAIGLYLAILGEVFDVTKGAQHYKPGSSYAFFTGRDASRSYVTGDFDNEENADDVSDLDDAALASLKDWLSFYHDEYPYIGKVIGRYYDQTGNPTQLLIDVQKKIENSKTNKWLEDQENAIFPPCNSEWSKEKGSRVWCTKKSGGIDRDWTGVPRKLFKKGKDPRCVCVRDSGPPSADPNAEKHNDLGDLEHQNLHEYPDCPKKAASCNVDHP